MMENLSLLNLKFEGHEHFEKLLNVNYTLQITQGLMSNTFDFNR